MADKLWHISNLDLFQGIAEGEVKSLATCARDVTYDSKYLLYTRGEEIDRVFLVKSGEVLLYHMHNGRRTVFDVLGPGDLFGNFSTQKLKVEHFAEVTPGTRVCSFPVDEVLKVLKAHPEAMLQTLRVLSERLADYEAKISLCTVDAKDKVYKELVRYQAKKNRSLFGKDEDAPIKLTHQKIAHLTGLNRVTVTRALHALEGEEKIMFNKENAIVIA